MRDFSALCVLLLFAALQLCSLPAQESEQPEGQPEGQPEEQSEPNLQEKPEEKPEADLHAVRFEFVGNENVGSKALHDSLSALRADLRRLGVDQGAVDDAVYELTEYYLSQGYRRVKVSATWAPKEAEFVVNFLIEEGPRSMVQELTFEGNQRLEAKKLGECFTWLQSGIILPFGEDVYTQGALDVGVDCVTTLHEIEGYYFVNVTPAVEETESGEVFVRVSIEEGPRIFLDVPPSFEGVTVTSEEALLEVLGLKVLEPTVYDARLPPAFQGKLVDHYRNLGYRFVEVEVDREIDPRTARATLHFKVEEGPLTRVRSINPSGTEWTRDWVIFERMALKAGDLYNEDKMRRGYRSLLRSGLFSAVSVEVTKVEGSDGLVDLDVQVSEKPRYRATVLGGYGSYELLRGGIVLENINFLGTGHRLRFEGKGSFRGVGGSLEYVNPYFFFEDLSHNIKGLAEVREQPSFTETRVEGNTGLSYRISDDLRTGLLYQIKESNVEDVALGVPPQLVEDVLLSTVAVSGVFDNRDKIYDPTSGKTLRLTVEYSGEPIGSEINFMRYVVFAGWVLPLLEDVQLVTAARVGVIQPIANTNTIPIQERFFTGGEYTIRSFLQDEAGPEINGDPVGGEAMTVLNVELRFPLFVLENLRGAVFFDTGTLTAQVGDIGGGRQFFGLGPAVRYKTPLGPVRMDVGWNPDRKRGEPEFLFHFGLGYPF